MELKIWIKDKWQGPFLIGPPDKPGVVDLRALGGVAESFLVKAQITGNDDELRKNYRLQIGYNPCCKFDKIGSSCGSKWHELFYEEIKYNKENKKERGPRTEAKLFLGAMGETILRFFEKKDGDEFDLWTAKVVVVPGDDRRDCMMAMIKELLPINPFLVFSTAWGLSKTLVTRRWYRESVELNLWSRLIEFEATEWLFNTMVPHLYGISRSPAENVSKGEVSLRIRNLRRLTFSDVRVVSRKIVLTKEAYVPTQSIVSDKNLIAHRVIGRYLKRCLNRLAEIRKEIDRLRERGQKEVNDPMSGDERRDYHRRAIKEELSLLERIERLEARIGACYCSGPWRGLRNDTKIAVIDPSEFGHGHHYRYVYSQLRVFEKMRFIWNTQEDETGERLTRRECVEENPETRDGPSKWLQNYTAMYEVWVFVRIVKSFESLGFEMLEQYRTSVIRNAIDVFMGQPHNCPICLRSVSHNDLIVEFCYGTAIPNKKKFDDDCKLPKRFCQTKDGTYTLTPDYTLYFIKEKKCYGMVLDAKSGCELHGHELVQREKYADKIRMFSQENDDWMNLNQTWLVYSGRIRIEKESEKWKLPFAGIEFSKMDGGECWEENWRDYWENEGWLPESINKPFRWSRKGISKNGQGKQFTRSQPFIGHLRVNALTAQKGNVFDEFVEGIVNTAVEVLK